MAAPSAMTLFQLLKQYIGDGTIDLDTDTINCAIMASGWTPNAATQSVWADISASEIANGNGYTTGGVALTGKTYIATGGVAAFKSSNPGWTGTGAGFAGRYYVFYKVGTANAKVNPLIGYGLLDSTPADVSFAPGNTINLVQPAAGWFTNT